jgi:hypothetical protein
MAPYPFSSQLLDRKAVPTMQTEERVRERNREWGVVGAE